jgi:hypothetical protein
MRMKRGTSMKREKLFTNLRETGALINGAIRTGHSKSVETKKLRKKYRRILSQIAKLARTNSIVPQ